MLPLLTLPSPPRTLSQLRAGSQVVQQRGSSLHGGRGGVRSGGGAAPGAVLGRSRLPGVAQSAAVQVQSPTSWHSVQPEEAVIH